MQKAVPVGEGAMAAILGLDFGAATRIATEAASDLYLTGAICQAANDNGGGQVVISGTKAAVERAIELAKLAGAKRAILLPVSAPFHCRADAAGGGRDGGGAERDADRPAEAAARRQRHGVGRRRARGDPRRARGAGDRHGALARERGIHESRRASPASSRSGTGKVLAGLIKRIAERATAISVGTPADVEAFKAAKTPSATH